MRNGLLFVEGRTAPVVRLAHADRFVERLVGLLGHRTLEADRGLWIEPCGSVHTLGMRFAIDVVFVGHDGRIVRIVEAMPSTRLALSRSASSVVELAAGAARRLGLVVGQQLQWGTFDRNQRKPLCSTALAHPSGEQNA